MHRLHEILIVEDSPADVRLIVEALKSEPPRHNITVASDGVEALECLNRLRGRGRNSLPDLILLDLNLPRKDGRELLAELKADPEFRRIPVVILTTSAADPDVMRAYELHANSYVTKPVDLDEFFAAVQAIDHFWLEKATLPPR